MTAYEQLKARLAQQPPATWLVTGAAGFIASHLVETLLRLGQRVRGLDNFATGRQKNLDEIRAAVTPAQWAQFEFVQGDIRDVATCQAACAGVDYVLHQAALGSVPGSMTDPLLFVAVNIQGTANLLEAARAQRVRRFVYASSCAVYGDATDVPNVEHRLGQVLSPYAATKLADELLAGTFARAYGLEVIGLRYFNIFGPRQDPAGPYAAVIPLWLTALLRGQSIYINGDGETTRDFCHVANIVQANLLSATTGNPAALGRAYNIALGTQTSLNTLFRTLRDLLAAGRPELGKVEPAYREFRPGDIRHSRADITLARTHLGFDPAMSVEAGLREALAWYRANLG